MEEISHAHQVAYAPPPLSFSCCAVETPLLLLASANHYAPDGLANESGQVGLNFMEVLAWSSSALHPENLGSYRGLPANSISWDYNAPDAIEDVVGGCRFNTGTAEAGLNGPKAYAQRIVGGWGCSHRVAMRDSCGRVITVGAIGESLSNAGTYVDLDPSEVDAFGKSHRWQNLPIMDASVFPSTGGGESPSLTIKAPGLRSAAHLTGV